MGNKKKKLIFYICEKMVIIHLAFLHKYISILLLSSPCFLEEK